MHVCLPWRGLSVFVVFLQKSDCHWHPLVFSTLIWVIFQVGPQVILSFALKLGPASKPFWQGGGWMNGHLPPRFVYVRLASSSLELCT